MDARRQIQCPTCTIEFTLDVPRTWVRCPSCGHGFVVKRVARDVTDEPAEAAPNSQTERPPPSAKRTGWHVSGPDGSTLHFASVDELRDAIARGDLEEPVPESEPMQVSLSEVEVAAPFTVPTAEAPPSAPGEAAAASPVSAPDPAAGIAPVVAPVELAGVERRPSDGPPSGERDRPLRRSSPPSKRERPASIPPASGRPASEAGAVAAPDDVQLVDDDDIDDIDDEVEEVDELEEVEEVAADGADTSRDLEETPMLLSAHVAPRPSERPQSGPAPGAKKATGTGISKAPPKPVTAAEAAEEETRERKTDPPKKPERKTSTSVARSVTPEPPARSWTLPLLGVAAAGAIAWAVFGPSKPPEPTPGAVGATGATGATSTVASAESVNVIAPSPPPSVTAKTEGSAPDPQVLVIPATTAVSVRTSTPSSDPHPAVSAAPATTAHASVPGGDGGGADAIALRAQAASAFRSGDLPKARLIYEQIVAKNAVDVEAWSALGDTARAQSSLADAESAYRRALGINPRYLPALIGLADLGWDNGDRPGAQKRYADLVEHYPVEMLPERVKQRGAPQ